MESRVFNRTSHTDDTEVPAVDFSADGPEPRYRLTTLGHDRLVRACAALEWIKRQTADGAALDLVAAFQSEIEAALAEVTMPPA